MCGIAGYWTPGQITDLAIAKRMADVIVHRGPDDSGVWCEPNYGLALAHRRLAILDLSSAGHQPMYSPCNRYVIVFNGEIYNHLTLRHELELAHAAPTWHGHSDTETLLAVLSHWGLEAGLKRLVGMFAFALWDRQEGSLSLARDRLGEKPLYYGWQGNTFLFGSELKALSSHPAFHGKINRSVLPLYFRYSYVPTPYSIYTGIQKLEPGTFITINGKPNQVLKPKTYWSLHQIITYSMTKPFSGSPVEAINKLEHLLRDTIKGQMITDVPLGAFLSGGIDSSLVVAMMQSMSPRPIKTFTIGFEEQRYNEAMHAKAIAQHLGTEHTELYVSSAQALNVIPKLPKLYDEPFADPSQIPTFLVAQLARQHVAVALSGDGGDELFGGYSRYSTARNMHNRLNHFPGALRVLIANLVGLVPLSKSARWNRRKLLLSSLLRSKGNTAFYTQLIGHWLTSDGLTLDKHEVQCFLNDINQQPALGDISDEAMYTDSITYLPDDILVKLDRAAMGTSLETRVPLLDHRIVEWAWTLPQSMKSQNGHEKWVLRQLLYRYVPQSLVDRPKMGFGVPIAEWLRGPLRNWAEDLLDANRIRNEGFLNSDVVQKKWREHLLGISNWEYLLWDVLMFQNWLYEQKI
ncbi:asparagine synthase (glutamine-hydrolyzing) [Photorhabdus namnaonensis]|uniref:asparagine synthase (glutamine-hydrolyzing) n=1 Tax=Photorhabdus namnaonensis TaxID=1851568 RepID=A0A1B8YNC1_9GAMM|nr:asparagine synthase (glutamine-hydrolyzing) [Photorhabdus namnaonensis]OCA56611.1 Asparagine synthetase [glutamine-hydrolyzing] 1 [Photorhabdus namnaonensis]